MNTIMAQQYGTIVLTFMERKILDMTRWVVLSVQLAYKWATFFTQIKNYRFGFQNMTVTYFRKSKFAATLKGDTSMKGLKGIEIGLFFVLSELY